VRDPRPRAASEEVRPAIVVPPPAIIVPPPAIVVPPPASGGDEQEVQSLALSPVVDEGRSRGRSRDGEVRSANQHSSG
jgi:hypothetical protein